MTALNAEMIEVAGGATADYVDTSVEFYKLTVADGLNVTGATDNTTLILAALNQYKRVQLPPTGAGQSIRISNSFAPPSGTQLRGSGMLELDRSTMTWSGFGTLLVGSITLATRTDVSLADFSLDATAAGTNLNGIVGPTNSVRRIRVSRVYTRSRNHGQLWEQNRASSPASADVQDVIVTDCKTSGAVAGAQTGNGFVSKARGVHFIRCLAYDTIQAFAAVSDNINGATTYSRAQDTYFIDCDGEANSFGWRVYSRDAFSTDNTNLVRPATNIHWIGGAIRGSTQSGARIGDNTLASQTAIPSEGVWIDGARISDNGSAGIQYLHLNGGGYSNCHFFSNGLTVGLNQNVTWATNGNVSGLVKGANSFVGPLAGQESLVAARTSSATLSTADVATLITNEGATALVTHTLPAAALGLEFSFCVQDTDGIRVVAAGSNTIRVAGSVSAAGGRIDSTTVGSAVTIKAINATEWVAVEVVGTWTPT
jgi:uncharacterized Zn-binding protein involved in type VI secretion